MPASVMVRRTKRAETGAARSTGGGGVGVAGRGVAVGCGPPWGRTSTSSNQVSEEEPAHLRQDCRKRVMLEPEAVTERSRETQPPKPFWGASDATQGTEGGARVV